MWRGLGPGLLFSGAAIGVSHLVQSTRAGALFGLALVGVIIVINILKYPTYRFGVDYAQATKSSLLTGYRRLGPWAIPLFCLVVAPVMPIVMTAVSATTAGIIVVTTGVSATIPLLASGVLVAVAALLFFESYDWVDRVNRVLVAVLIVTTLLTTMLVLDRVEWGALVDFGWTVQPAALLFLVALAGFMPNPLDLSVVQSIWIREAQRGQAEDVRPGLAQQRMLFLAPYIMTTVLAVCFCIMGAGVMHSGGVSPASDAAGFAAQVIGLYSETLGPYAALLASVAALSVMATTVLAALDAYSRLFAGVYAEYVGSEISAGARRAVLIVIVLSAIAVLNLFFGDFAAFIDLTTSLVFLSAPIVALLNHLVVTRTAMPDEARPSPALRAFNGFAILCMMLLAAVYFLA
ncbi:MAG: hypothetical protein V2J26_11425 [Pacificimonas sp.]|jgi:Mn2+/Fe2+ NRAMP family transporter|nr:hypothetical protein [Pacificimonas sp.]